MLQQLRHENFLAYDQVAQTTLTSLLEAELSHLSHDGQTSDGAWPEQINTDASRDILTEYRQEVVDMLEVQLVQAKSVETRPLKKKKSRSNKRKHKQTSQSDGA